MGCREHRKMLQLTFDLPGQHIHFRDTVDLIPEKLHTDRRISIVCRKDFQRISPYTERTAVKIHVVSRILNIDQRADHVISVLLHPRS